MRDPARGATIRQALREEMRDFALTARELSARVSIREREVAEHLAHLARSLPREGERLVVEPARCVGCGFRFEKRERFTRPSRCPVCRGERIEAARFTVEAGRG
jgi:predicted Zn-ribbon and HTH transcriptional regulator